MAKFRYAPIPHEVLCDPNLSWTMKGRYALLLGAAFNNEVLDLSLDEIAELWSEAEGELIDPESVGWYLTQMAKAGLIQRERKDKYTWHTKLLKRYDPQHSHSTAQPDSPQPQHSPQLQFTAQSTQPQCETLRSSKGQTARPLAQAQGQSSETLRPGSGSLVTNSVVVVDDLSLQQQQTYFSLVRFGVFRETALDLARRGVAPEDVKAWIEYIQAHADDIRNPPGLLVANLGAGRRPPVQDAKRRRWQAMWERWKEEHA